MTSSTLHQQLEAEFEDAATLACSAWSGDDQAEAFAPAAEWETTASTGRVAITIDGDDTTDLAPGNYLIQLAITASGSTAIRRIATLRLLAAPGSAEALSTYATAEDMRRQCSWIEDLQTEQDQLGFAEQRHEARMEFERLLQLHYRGPANGSRQTTLDHLLDGGWSFRAGGDDATLQDWLDDDRLMLTGPTGEAIIRWNALTAIALVLDDQVGSKGDSSYQELAALYRRLADNLARSLTPGIDTTDTPDGVADIWISLATTDRIRC